MAESGLGTAPARVRETSDPGSNAGGTATATSAAVQRTQTQAASAGASYDPLRASGSLAVNSNTEKLQQTTVRFFVITGLSLLEALFFSLSDIRVAVACGVVAVAFGGLGALAHRLNKAVIMAGMLLYVAETALMVAHGWNTTMIMVAYGVFVHCAIIYRLYLSYDVVGNLQSA